MTLFTNINGVSHEVMLFPEYIAQYHPSSKLTLQALKVAGEKGRLTTFKKGRDTWVVIDDLAINYTPRSLKGVR